MISSSLLEDDFERSWNQRHGIVHGPLSTSWSGRDPRDLFCWSIHHLSAAIREQDDEVSVEVLEEDGRPVALLYHGARGHVLIAVQLVAGRVLRLVDDGGRHHASIDLNRRDHQFTRRVAELSACVAARLASIH